jgi:DNA-directed RNA polymerase specialized sigma24 family protein
MTPDGSVSSWIAQLREGEQQAVERLWDRYFPRLIQLARIKMRELPKGTRDAEDVALSAFHTCYQALVTDRLRGVRTRDELWRTLVLFVSGKAIDERRRLLSLKRGGPAGPAKPLADELEDLTGGEPDPAFTAQLWDEFAVRLARLDDDESRQVVLLRLQGYDNDEIAQRLGCSGRSVRRRLLVIRRVWEEEPAAPGAETVNERGPSG